MGGEEELHREECEEVENSIEEVWESELRVEKESLRKPLQIPQIPEEIKKLRTDSQKGEKFTVNKEDVKIKSPEIQSYLHSKEVDEVLAADEQKRGDEIVALGMTRNQIRFAINEAEEKKLLQEIIEEAKITKAEEEKPDQAITPEISETKKREEELLITDYSKKELVELEAIAQDSHTTLKQIKEKEEQAIEELSKSEIISAEIDETFEDEEFKALNQALIDKIEKAEEKIAAQERQKIILTKEQIQKLNEISKTPPRISDLMQSNGETPLFKLGDYNILEKIGEGAFCDAYRAKSSTGRTVCIKVLKNAELRQTLEKQVRINHRLNHKYIVPIEQAELNDDTPWFVMKYIEGGHLITTDKRDLETILQIFGNICEAISYAHEQGVIHKDIKPANILMDKSGEKEIPFVTDLGISSIIDSESLQASLVTAMSGAGTFGYMAPEKVNELRHGIQTNSTKQHDIYSLGTLLYELLTQGDLPSTDVVEELKNQGIDEQIIKIVKKSTAKNINNRYSSVEEIQADLRRIIIIKEFFYVYLVEWKIVR